MWLKKPRVALVSNQTNPQVLFRVDSCDPTASQIWGCKKLIVAKYVYRLTGAAVKRRFTKCITTARVNGATGDLSK